MRLVDRGPRFEQQPVKQLGAVSASSIGLVFVDGSLMERFHSCVIGHRNLVARKTLSIFEGLCTDMHA